MLAEPLARLLARRRLVIGLLTASSATGQLASLPLAAWLAEHHGWRVALVPALLSCTAAAVLAVLVLRDHPADLGLLPYGKPAGAPLAYAPALTGSFVGAAFAILTEAARARVFWLLFGTFFMCGLSINGLIQTHLLPFYADFGIPEAVTASLLAAVGAFDFVGTVASGWLSDRFDSRRPLFWYYGLDWIATVPPTVRLAGSAFGREKAPLVFDWVFSAHQLGAATAAFGAGWSRIHWRPICRRS